MSDQTLCNEQIDPYRLIISLAETRSSLDSSPLTMTVPLTVCRLRVNIPMGYCINSLLLYEYGRQQCAL